MPTQRITKTQEGGTNINSYSVGDILYCSATDVLTKLPATDDGKVLTLVNGIPDWQGSVSPVEGSQNIGIALASNVFSIVGADGAAISVTNPAQITLQNKASPGQLIQYHVTSGGSFTDGAAGDLVGMKFGINPTGTDRDWDEDMPYFLYAIGDDTQTNIVFAIGRNPSAKLSPAAASLGKAGAVVNVGQNDMFLMSNVTVADYDLNPCICLGAIRMQYTASGTFWTVSTLNNIDGIGNFHEITEFTMPKGVMNSNAGTWYLAVGATTGPTWSSELYSYFITRQGRIFANITQNTCTANGSAAVGLNYVLPYAVTTNQASNNIVGNYSDSSSNRILCSVTTNGNASATASFRATGTSTDLQRNSFGVGAYTMGMQFNFQAFEA